MIQSDEIEQMVRGAIPGAQVTARDMTGTGDHWEIQVTSAAFQGKGLLEQHRMVMAALAGEMDRRIHAVQLKTRAA